MSKGTANNRRMILVSIFVSLLVFTILYVWMQRTTPAVPLADKFLFDRIASYKLERQFIGEEAFGMVEKSHLGELSTPRDAAIGYYQQGVTVWIAEYEESE